MRAEIRPLERSETPELALFLAEGFAGGGGGAGAGGGSAGASFASPAVLDWKYFDPDGLGPGPRSFIIRESGSIVGHVGICRNTFAFSNPQKRGQSRELSALLIIDWLVARSGEGMGAYLMMHAHRLAEIQLGMGTSAAAKRVGEAFGYKHIVDIPIYERVFRPSHRFARCGEPVWKSALKAARDQARAWGGRLRGRFRTGSRTALGMAPVESFASDRRLLDFDLQRNWAGMTRSAESLDHSLRYPGGGGSVFALSFNLENEPAGFAVLSVVIDGGVRIGKINEIVTIKEETHLQTAITLCTEALRSRGADAVRCYASEPSLAQALRAAGYFPGSAASFHIRDKRGLLPPGLTYRMMSLEGDYAYTP